MIKLLHAGDFHLGARFRGLPPEKAAGKKAAQLAMLERLEALCHDRQCSLVLLTGDLFDRPQGDPDSFRALGRCLEAMAVPVFIAPGNHDYLAPDSPYSQGIWPKNVHIFTKEAISSVALPALDLRVWGAGYSSMDCPPLLEGFRAAGPERYQLMALHGDPTAAGSPCCPVTRGQIAGSNLTYLALGHIHKAGTLEAGGTLCAWPGCPMGRGFDETGDKGVYIVTLDDAAHAEFIPLGLGRYEDRAVEAGDDPLASILACLPADTREDVYRITLTGPSEPPELDALKDALRERFFDLQLRDRTELPRDLWQQAGDDSLEGLYFRLLRESAENADGEAREIFTLAARISRRLLDGQEVTLP